MNLYRVGLDQGFGMFHWYVQAESYERALVSWKGRMKRLAAQDGDVKFEPKDPHEVALVTNPVVWADEVTP